MLLRIANKLLSPVGVKLVPKKNDLLVYQHDYGADGFVKYREEQIRANQEKLDWIWADERTLEVIASDILDHGLARSGLCHGARSGWEVQWFAKRLHCTVIGTDISETAAKMPNMVVHDFHDRRQDWTGQFSFIYTNSLDQAFDPRKALEAWAGQLTPNGRIYIEHTMQHSPSGASAMDPFGAHPMAVPYLLFEWGKGIYALSDILHVEQVERKGHVWVFVLCKARSEP